MTGTLVITHGPNKASIAWDTDHANGSGPLDPAIAAATFDQNVDRMFAFAETVAGEPAEQIKKGEFDPQTQSKVTMTPQIAGGRR
jgi:hypothetical protein